MRSSTGLPSGLRSRRRRLPGLGRKRRGCPVRRPNRAPASATAAVGSPGQQGPGEAGENGAAAPERELPGGAESGGEVSGIAPEPESEPTYDPVEEQERYQLAFDLLSEGRFERAAAAFAEFLATFPESRYHDTARFWKGECLYALRRFEPALSEFRMLVEDHPDSSRIPGARLKIGFILHELGRAEEAAEESEGARWSPPLTLPRRSSPATGSSACSSSLRASPLFPPRCRCNRDGGGSPARGGGRPSGAAAAAEGAETPQWWVARTARR